MDRRCHDCRFYTYEPDDIFCGHPKAFAETVFGLSLNSSRAANGHCGPEGNSWEAKKSDESASTDRWKIKIVLASDINAAGEWRDASDAVSAYLNGLGKRQWANLRQDRLELPEGYIAVALRRIRS